MTFSSRYNQHLILMDASKESGGDDSGSSPKSLLLSSLAGCSGIDVVSILEKMKVVFSDLRIEASGEQTEEHPRVFKSFELKYSIRCAGEDEAKVRRAIELSLDKYCGVAAMLRTHAAIHWELEVKGDG